MTVDNPIPYWPEQLEEWARRRRDQIAIYRLYGEAYNNDVYRLREWMMALIWEWRKSILIG